MDALNILALGLAAKGGGGGTSDYSDLTNKPQINNVTLSGNKSLSDLGIPTYSAGTNVSINNGVISATDTTYSAGDNISVSGTSISLADTINLEKRDAWNYNTAQLDATNVVFEEPDLNNMTTVRSSGIQAKAAGETEESGYHTSRIASGSIFYENINANESTESWNNFNDDRETVNYESGVLPGNIHVQIEDRKRENSVDTSLFSQLNIEPNQITLSSEENDGNSTTRSEVVLTHNNNELLLNNGAIPHAELPSSDGTYTLKCELNNGSIRYFWDWA